MKKVTQVDRVLKILDILSQGRTISLAKDPIFNEICLLRDMRDSNYKFDNLNIGLRALQKDMAYIKEYLGDNLSKEGNSYRLVKKEYMDDFFKENHKEIKKFFHAISLIDKSLFGDNFKKYSHLLDSIQTQQKGVYLFLENPFENLKQLNLKDKLEQFIQERRYINIEYYTDKLFKFKRVQPYKIIYQNGNWYVAVLTTEDYKVNGGFKLLRLNFIKKLNPCKFEPYHFHEEINIKDFLENKFQSLFTSYDKEFFTVKIIVSKKIERYFQVKNFLKSQRILEKTKDGLIIEFTINDDMEIIPMVQTWIPYIKIIEPVRLHERIMENIRQYN